MVSGITSSDYEKSLSYSDFQAIQNRTASSDNESEDISIFETAAETSGENGAADESAETLYEELSAIEDENGVILNAWNGFKELTNIGTSAEKCEDAIEQYQTGEITYEEASEIIDNYGSKQESSLNLFSNIATSLAAIGAAAAIGFTGGLAAPIVAGVLAGAATKASFKTVDRATNDVEGDALDAKQIAQDALSGAVTGGIAAATMGTGANTFTNGFSTGAKTFKGIAACMLKSAKTGTITGAVSGSSNYLIDCAFDEDKDFDTKEFVETTAVSTAVGGAVGAFMGGLNGVLRYNNVLSAADDNVIADSVSSAGYKIANDKLNSIAA